MKTVLVLGDQGYIGYRLASLLSQYSDRFQVIGTDLTSKGQTCLDITDEDALRAFVGSCNPDIIIYCSATRIFESESNPDKAYATNVAPVAVLKKCFSGKLVYFSSCHVFDGESAPYKEEDAARPTSVYGQTKVAAEKIICDSFRDHLIVRPGYVYGYNGRQHDHFASTVLKRIAENTWPLQYDATVTRNPIILDELCERVIALLTQDKIKILQLNGNSAVTKFVWCAEILKSLSYPVSDIHLLLKVAEPKQEAFIAKNTAMVNTYEVQDDFLPSIAGMGDVFRATLSENHFLGEALTRFSSAIALIEGDDHCTYMQLDERSTSMAHGFLERGIQPGERIAMLLPNSIDLVVAYFACWKIGAICVPLMPKITAEHMPYALKTTAPKILLAKESLWDQYSHCDIPFGMTIFFSGIDPENPSALIQLYSEKSTPLAAIKMDQVATILFTSGSTGNPKGAMHTRDQLLHVANIQSTLLQLDAGSRSLPGTSLCHGFTVGTMLLPFLCTGGSVVLLDKPKPQALLESFNRHQVTHYAGTPVHYEPIKDYLIANPRALDDCSLVSCNCSGDVLLESTLIQLRSAGLPVYTSIGMTETHTIAKNTPQSNKEGSSGPLLPGVRIKITDSGEVLLKSPTTMTGYWQDPVATQSAFDDDGWFRTGDQGDLVDDFYYFRGRIKQVIRHQSVNFAPQTIESWASEFAGIKESACVGVKHDVYGQQCFVYVVIQEEARERSSDILAGLFRALQTKLGDYGETALLGIDTIDAMPLISLGKINRSALLERCLDSQSEETPVKAALSRPVYRQGTTVVLFPGEGSVVDDSDREDPQASSVTLCDGADGDAAASSLRSDGPV